MTAQSMPPSECGVSPPFYMKTDSIIISLAILWHGFKFCLNTIHKITQSRLAFQEKSANIFSTVLVPILAEREAVQSRQQIFPSAADLLRVSLELWALWFTLFAWVSGPHLQRSREYTALALDRFQGDELFHTSSTRQKISEAEGKGYLMRLDAAVSHPPPCTRVASDIL